MKKVCSMCREEKDRAEFVTVGNLCKECKRIYDRGWYKKNRKNHLARQKMYDKTEVGRKVNRRASIRYNSTPVQRRWYWRMKRNPEKYQQHLLQMRARNNFHYALKVGKLQKGVCEECNSKDVQGHHDDYAKPLEVQWFCPLHHGKTRQKEVLV